MKPPQELETTRARRRGEVPVSYEPLAVHFGRQWVIQGAGARGSAGA